MAKKLVRLTESDLHKIIKESIKKILKEESYSDLNVHNFVIVLAFDNIIDSAYNKLIKYYADAMIQTKYNGNVFLLRKKDAFSFDGMPNIEFYEIPSYIKSIDEIEEALIDGEICLEDLKVIDSEYK